MTKVKKVAKASPVQQVATWTPKKDIVKAVAANLAKFQEFAGKMNDDVQRKIIKALESKGEVYMNIAPDGVIVRKHPEDKSKAPTISFRVTFQLCYAAKSKMTSKTFETVTAVVSAYNFFKWINVDFEDAASFASTDGNLYKMFQIQEYKCNSDYHPRFYHAFTKEDYSKAVSEAPVRGTTEQWDAWNAEVDAYRNTLKTEQKEGSEAADYKYKLLNNDNASSLLVGAKPEDMAKIAIPTRVAFKAKSTTN